MVLFFKPTHPCGDSAKPTHPRGWKRQPKRTLFGGLPANQTHPLMVPLVMMMMVVSVGWQRGGGEWVVVMERRVAASGCGDRIDRVGCDAALETLHADMEACEKATLMKKAYDTLTLCLGDRILWEVTKETTALGI
ncbi:hypothetical protein Tco_0213415 [Tanacetum coccineum]